MYCVFDTETTITETFKRKANPFDKANYIVAMGYKTGNNTYLDYYPESHNDDITSSMFSKNIDLLIGFNIKFDLLWIWKYKSTQDYLLNGGKIWCCQLAEFMLSGQTHKFPSLNEVASKYGGTLKDEWIAEQWKNGINTNEIDKDRLLEYLKHDVFNTELVYLKQREEAKKQGMLKLIELEMEALLATTEMEYNGMYINKDKIHILKANMEQQINVIKDNIYKELQYKYPIDVSIINIDSNDHLSAVLFGGDITQKIRKVIGVYKTGAKKGEDRYKINEKVYRFEGLFKPLKAWKRAKAGFYSVDIEVLNKLDKSAPLIDYLIQYRDLSKQLNTYYLGILNLIQEDGLVHHKLNHCVTRTGRLSSSDPNLQNQPRDGDVKKVYCSRWDDGVLLELDFSSLEFVGAAFLCQDRNMINDISNGVDIHRRTAAKTNGIPEENVTHHMRQQAKRATFELLYGAGENKIALTQFNNDINMAKAFKRAFFGRYKAFQNWQTNLCNLVTSKKYPTEFKTKRGIPAKEARYITCTGRLLKFIENDSPDFLRKDGVLKSINPAEVKNYPVQSLSTADIVLIQIGKLFRWALEHKNKCLLINTVHDSVILDVKKEYLTFVAKYAKLILEDVANTMGTEFKLHFNVPIATEAKYGPSWGDMINLEGENH